MSARYAVYFAPPAKTALWRFGSFVLGYDAWAGVECPQWCPPGTTPARWHTLTTDPRLYGFHATLKAPFALIEGRREIELVTAADAFAAKMAPLVLEGVAVTAIRSRSSGGVDLFLALTETAPSAALAALEVATVTTFDPFRGPLDPADRARRLSSGLTPAQIEKLDAWGYPFIFDEFRFHMTLSGRIPEAEGEAIHASLADAFRAAVPEEPLIIDRVAIFKQPDRSARFTIMSEHVFKLPSAS